MKKGKPGSSNLVFAKGRLAPKKEISLPRLELLAAVIGIRSLRFVKEQSRLPISQLILFTDSQCVLHWLCSTKNLERFVANRLKEIKACPNVSYRYVNTKDNPADLPTRRRSVQDLGTFWFQGPKWLLSDEREWPKYDMPVINQDTLQRIENSEKPNCSVLFEAGFVAGEGPTDVHPPCELNLAKYSSIKKVYRITAWCLRFTCRTKGSCSSSLNAAELTKEKLLWDKYIQRLSFPEVFKDLKRAGSSIIPQGGSPIIRQLSLFLDSDGLIRCSGRLKNSDLKLDAIYPKLLPKKHLFTDLNILDCHSRMAHSGASQTLAEFRSKYWITHGRTIVKGILKSCRVCRRREGGSFKRPIIPDLPCERVVKADPFSHAGVDYFGPLYIKENGETSKCWVCLYTCMVTRAVHLELMMDMTTEQFILGFRRFSARRGKPTLIVSDNARQFRLSKDVIAEMWGSVVRDPVVQDFSASRNISWKFIVQLAPWMGGFYERLVGLVKRALKKALGQLCLGCDQLCTLLTEIEWIINSRPLAYVGDELTAAGILTPVKLLYIGAGNPMPIIDCDEGDDLSYIPDPNLKNSVIRSWKKGLRHLDVFWNIWKSEYLLSLRERSSRHRTPPGSVNMCPEVGQIVLLKENLIPRGRWRLARVLSINKSKDNMVRSATVVVASGSKFSRPVNHLFPLETETVDFNDLRIPQQNEITEAHPSTVIEDSKEKRPDRRAALQARQRISDILLREDRTDENE